MPDGDLRVDLARLAGQLDGIVGRLNRAETDCATRAATHVGAQVYERDRRETTGDIDKLEATVTSLRADLAKAEEKAASRVGVLEDKLTASRRHAAMLALGIFGVLVTIAVAVL